MRLRGRVGCSGSGEERWEREEVAGAARSARHESEDFSDEALLYACLLEAKGGRLLASCSWRLLVHATFMRREALTSCV